MTEPARTKESQKSLARTAHKLSKLARRLVFLERYTEQLEKLIAQRGAFLLPLANDEPRRCRYTGLTTAWRCNNKAWRDGICGQHWHAAYGHDFTMDVSESGSDSILSGLGIRHVCSNCGLTKTAQINPVCDKKEIKWQTKSLNPEE